MGDSTAGQRARGLGLGTRAGVVSIVRGLAQRVSIHDKRAAAARMGGWVLVVAQRETGGRHTCGRRCVGEEGH